MTDAGAREGEERWRLRSFILFDLATAATAVVIVLLVWLTLVPSVWLLVLAAMCGGAALLMLAALFPLRDGRLEPAVRWIATANWSIALGASAIATFAWPLMALAALLPAVLAVPYASGRALTRYLAMSLLACIGVTTVGLLQDFSGFSSEVAGELQAGVLIGFIPFLGGMIVLLGFTNHHHLQRALVEARAINERLRASEEALADHASELRASRARVVAATDRERRRIERDLHDGAQQRLVALSVRLSLARDLARRNGPALGPILDELRAEVKAAQAELNDLAQGVYPPVLTQHGLAAALRSAATRCPNPLELDIGDVGRHPRDLEAAIYFCCVEALQNATKHAGAGAVVRVRLAIEGDEIRFVVADEGVGFDVATTRGSNGFTNMQDRIGSSGGVVEIASTVGVGTTVSGRVPLPVGA